MPGADHEDHSEPEAADPESELEGPTELTQTDNRPTERDPATELPQGADFDPADDPESA